MGSTRCKFSIIALLAAAFFLTGCYQSFGYAVAKEPAKLSAWLAYWDLESGGKDLERVSGKLEKLSYFGAYFDYRDRLYIPKELISKRKSELKKGRYETYLSFVNDKQLTDGSFSLKDIEVLRRQFADEKAMDKHIEDIIGLTLQEGFDGIEIDYERIWKDELVGQSFLRFADKLYAEALKNKLKLRIVLEPSSPFSQARFPKGPEYVIMFYNLYGLHSDPGPKANKEFIKKTLARVKQLPGERSIAFSTGGCLWGDNGEKRFLTEAEANELATRYGRELKRDKNSQNIVFSYTDKGVTFHVWYADVETLNYWILIAKEQGEKNISLWRLGGNTAIDKVE